MKNAKSPLVFEALLALAVLAALALLINPANIIMTSVFTLTLLMIMAIALIAFGVFIWREQPRDEREALHGMQASRVAYFAGALVLVGAVIEQVLTHRLDAWLAVALGAMVLTKLVIRGWYRNR